MEFRVEKNNAKYESDKNEDHYSKDDVDIAYTFAKSMHKEFGKFLKAIVLFGSHSRHTKKATSDIDILLVVDDVTFRMTSEVVEAYRVIVEKYILKISPKIHVTTLKFTSFWDLVRVGDPVGLNILRDGVALIDTGFFTPLQILLKTGKIRPSYESMQSYMARAPHALFNSQAMISRATIDLYWAVIDASHAAIMKIGLLPPTPEQVSHVLQEKLVKPGLIPKDAPKTVDMFYKLSKKIIHKKIKNISGKEYDAYYHQADKFVTEMKKFVKKHE